MDIYNFRIDQEHSNVLVERLKNEKCICMGWGGGDIFNLDPRHDDNELWHDYKKCYKEITTHRYNSICKIKYFIDGDIIVVPHLPVYGKFIIGIVEGDFENCYSYIENDETHLNHKIKLKKIYGLDSHLDIHNTMVHSWYAKLNWMRLPIYPLFRYNNVFNDLIKYLELNPEIVIDKSDIGDFFDNLRNEIKLTIKSKLNAISPNNSKINFEKICQELILSYGYTHRRSNHHKKGGDADIIFDISKDISSPFEKSSSALYVQVKKHEGESNKLAITQLIKIMNEDDKKEDSQGCAITLGEFNKEAIDLADKNDIVLINGDELVDMIIEKLL